MTDDTLDTSLRIVHSALSTISVPFGRGQDLSELEAAWNYVLKVIADHEQCLPPDKEDS